MIARTKMHTDCTQMHNIIKQHYSNIVVFRSRIKSACMFNVLLHTPYCTHENSALGQRKCFPSTVQMYKKALEALSLIFSSFSTTFEEEAANANPEGFNSTYDLQQQEHFLITIQLFFIGVKLNKQHLVLHTKHLNTKSYILTIEVFSIIQYILYPQTCRDTQHSTEILCSISSLCII